MTTTYILDGLCCPNCAAKIDAAAKKIPNVTNAEADYGNTSITLTFGGDESSVRQAVIGICAGVDEDITVKEA